MSEVKSFEESLEEMDKYLSWYEQVLPNHPIFFNPEMVYTKERIEKLRLLKEKHVSGYFYRCLDDSGQNFNVVKECVCGRTKNLILSFNQFKVYISNRVFDYLCSSCKELKREEDRNAKSEIDRRAKERREELQEKLRLDRQQTTPVFIESFLSTEKRWTDPKKIKQNFDCLASELRNSDQSAIAEHIKAMPYYDFLKTPYWVAIAQKAKLKANFRCAICNSYGNLNAHHRTYEIHGHEIDNIDELTVLCKPCHEKHHFD